MQKTLRGFTLVELAIVMTIIGLLIGGILKGQELLQQARLTSTIAQIKSFEAATTAFEDIYNGLPGDLLDAGKKLPNCANCSPDAGSANDGFITANGINGCKAYAPLTLPATTATGEVSLFWLHLLKANLISGVADNSSKASAPVEFGNTYPAAKLGGGFLATTAGYGVFTQMTGLNMVTQEPNAPGLYIVTHASPDLCTDEDGGGNNALTPGQAAQIDRKMDDGRPQTGSVIGNGSVSPEEFPCFVEDGSGVYLYDESSTLKGCEVFVRIKN